MGIPDTHDTELKAAMILHHHCQAVGDQLPEIQTNNHLGRIRATHEIRNV
jgi:hypothetical protein